jgi:Protein of unknown function (DUF3313)
MRCFRLVICCGGLVLAGCASHTPKTTGGLELPLQPSQYPGTLVYRAPDVQSGKYKAIFVDSADIYRAADADFGGASEEDKARLAERLSTEFKNALTKHHYTLVSQSGEGVVRLHLILAGIKESKPVAATVLRLTPLGLGASAAKTVTGGSSALVGSVTVSGELLDAESGEALAGFVATESPIALDLTSGLTKLRAAELGIERGSEDFAAALDRYLKRTPT